jgi:hypothetical protein
MKRSRIKIPIIYKISSYFPPRKMSISVEGVKEVLTISGMIEKEGED